MEGVVQVPVAASVEPVPSGVPGGCRDGGFTPARLPILARRERGESIRTIANNLGISIGVVHKALTLASPQIDQSPEQAAKRD